MVTDFRRLFQALIDGAVEFIIVGGVALVLHGSARTTQDLDICYARDPANLARLAHALQPTQPALRGAPPGLPFSLDETALHNGLNFTLETNFGQIDLLGEIAGIGGFPALLPDSVWVRYHDLPVRILTLDALERAKAAAGRVKDALDIAEIRLIRERQRR